MTTLPDHLKLLLRLFWQPAAAMSAILDRGSREGDSWKGVSVERAPGG